MTTYSKEQKVLKKSNIFLKKHRFVAMSSQNIKIKLYPEQEHTFHQSGAKKMNLNAGAVWNSLMNIFIATAEKRPVFGLI